MLVSDSLEKGDTNIPLKDVAVRNAKPTEKCLDSCPMVVDFTFSSSPAVSAELLGRFFGLVMTQPSNLSRGTTITGK